MEKDPENSALPIDDFIKVWISEKIQKSLEPMKENKVEPLILQIKSFSMATKNGKIYNRVELDSDFDFKTIEEILLSPEEKHQNHENLYYTTVVLFGPDKKAPMIFPYCFHKIVEQKKEEIDFLALEKKQRKKLKKKLKKNEGEQENQLDKWIFLNNKSEEALHTIKSFSMI